MCDDSSVAKEKMRFNRRERWEIFWSLMKVSYSSGRGGRGGMSANLLPFGPQQKPGLSPVKRATPQTLHECVVPRLFVGATHRRLGEEIGPISHVDWLSV